MSEFISAMRLSKIQPSATLAISAQAKAMIADGVDVINVSAGEPDFDTPQHIKEAAKAAMDAGYTRYTAVDGIADLKTAICAKFNKENGLSYTTDQIIVSTGAKQSIFNCLMALLNPGDEVIIPAPYWVSYPSMVEIAEAEPVILGAGHEQHFKITPEQLSECLSERTRAFLLNSPSNPTGAVYTREELKALGEVLLAHPQVVIISDDIYEHIIWQEESFCNIVNAAPELYEQTVVINGVSKAYAMTGWRIGYAAGAPAIIAAMKKLQSQSTSNASSISQYAALAALEGKQDSVHEMTKSFHQRHNFAFAELQKIPGVAVARAHGAFYLFPNVDEVIQSLPNVHDDITLAKLLLDQGHVAVVPGTAFGAPGYIRISTAVSEDDLRQAIDRMATVFSG